MNIIRKKHIPVPANKVYSIVSNMGDWQPWSPWLISEPDTQVNVAPDNKSYSWEGKRVGAGKMKVTNEIENRKVDYDLTFLKPWKSKAKVSFELIEKNGGTDVTWTMDSSLPWYLFWMKKMTEAYVGNDYERGLNLLDDYAREGVISSKLNWIGKQQFAGGTFIGIKRNCTIDEMPKLMEADFTKLMEFGSSFDGARPQEVFSQYHKFDFVKNLVSYTAGLPVASVSKELPSNFYKGNLPSTEIYTLEHKGLYEHLGNAWATMYMMHRNKEFKSKKGYHPFETYGNDPKDTAPKDLITYVNFAIN